MPLGQGKYDDLCTHVRDMVGADGAAVIIFNGVQGSGFSVQAPLEIQLGLPDMLEHMAREIRESFKGGRL